MSGASNPRHNPPPRLSRKIAQLLRSKQGVGLDLGCGPNKQDGFIGIDSRPLPQVDIVWDLERFPWPLPDNCAHAVVMSHFWEHIHPRNTLRFMEELHRVCKNGARVFISGPYANGFRYVQDPTHCFSDDTEVLTVSEGFQPIHAVQIGESVVTLNPDTFAVSESECVRVIRERYRGSMVHVKNISMDLLVTPNHSILSGTNCLKPKYKLHRADDLLKLTGRHSRTAYARVDWAGVPVQHVEIPRVRRGGNNAARKMPISFRAEPFMSFMGWYLSEGSVDRRGPSRNSYMICIAQSKVNQQNREEIFETVRQLGMSPKMDDKSISFSSKDLYHYLEPLGHSSEKFVPRSLKSMPKDLLLRLLDSALKGDGRSNGFGWEYATISRKLADDIQEIAIKCGFRTNLRMEKRGPTAIIHGRTVKVSERIYIVGISKDQRLYYPRAKRVDYDGRISCITVEKDHVILVRRNGKVCWSGNCNPSNEATWCYWEPHHVLWNVYQSPAYFHGSDTFQLVPAGNDKDFNVVLRACKPPDGKCPHKIG